MKFLFSLVFCFFLNLFFVSYSASAAEVMQVRDSSTLLIGDNNRTYTVRISCLDVKPGLDNDVLTWLRKELPRKTKVNLRPKGFNDGVLLAKVFPKGTDEELSESIQALGFANSTC